MPGYLVGGKGIGIEDNAWCVGARASSQRHQLHQEHQQRGDKIFTYGTVYTHTHKCIYKFGLQPTPQTAKMDGSKYQAEDDQTVDGYATQEEEEREVWQRTNVFPTSNSAKGLSKSASSSA